MMQFVGSLWEKAKTEISVAISSLEGDYYFFILAVLMAVCFLCPNILTAFVLSAYSVLYLAYLSKRKLETKQNVLFKCFVCIVGTMIGMIYFFNSIQIIIAIVFVLVLFSNLLGILAAIICKEINVN